MEKSKHPFVILSNEDELNNLRKLFLEARPAIVPGTKTNPYLWDEAGQWDFKPRYIAGVDPYKEDGEGSAVSWATIKIKNK